MEVLEGSGVTCLGVVNNTFGLFFLNLCYCRGFMCYHIVYSRNLHGRRRMQIDDYKGICQMYFAMNLSLFCVTHSVMTDAPDKTGQR